MRFNMGQSWQDAMSMLSANREVMLVLAGVFLFLPSLAFSLLVPQAEPPVGASQEVMQQYVFDFYRNTGPYFLLLGLIQAAGLIAMQSLLRDDGKPTVGQAIKNGFVGLLPYIGASLIVGIGLGVAFGLVFAMLAATGSGALMTVGIIACVAALVYLWVRLSLITAVIAIDKISNPIRLLQRAWNLTRGNALMLFVYFLLLMVVLLVVSVLIGLVGGLITAIAGSGTLQALLTGILSGLVGSIGMMIFVAVIASVHRQLSGPSRGDFEETFR